MKNITGLILGLSVLSGTFLNAQTHISGGNVSGTWTASSSPYIIDGEIKIDTTDLLVIEPGVDILFSGHYKFIVHGRLLAVGTETDSIHLTAQDKEVGWHGLRFDHTDLNEQDSSKLDYCILDYAKAYGMSRADSIGGALSCDSSSNLLINNSLFCRNSAFHYGGGIYLYRSDINIKNSIIDNNELREWDGGAGIGVRFCNSLKLSNVVISNNRSVDGNGGGLFIRAEEPLTTVELIDVDIYNNSSGDRGGGMYADNYDVDLIVSNCKIHDNTTDESGGGMYGMFNIVSSENFRVYNNSAGDYGGGIAFVYCGNSTMRDIVIYNNHARVGGAISAYSCTDLALKNLTLVDNSASNVASGIFIQEDSEVHVSNCIVRNDGAVDEIILRPSGLITVDYTNIKGGYPGTDNIDLDPLYTDQGGNDYSLSWDHYPEADTTQSPCIDSGDPLVIDPDGTRSDMGAIPYDQVYSPIPSGDISGTLTCAGSPYYVFGDITVQAGDELIVEPCVYMIFRGDYKLTVYGRLLAEGTEADNIMFCPADSITGWQGIRFYELNSNGQDSSKLVHCSFLHGNADGAHNDNYGGAVYANLSSNILVDNCRFYGNRADISGGALMATNHSSPVVRNSVFVNNHALYGGAVLSYHNSNTTFQNCYFSGNNAENGGAVVVSSCVPSFSGTTMTNNRATKFGGAFYHDGGQAATFDAVHKCNVYDNYADFAGLDFFTAADVYIPPVHDVYLDTATVSQMNEHIAFPIQYFNISSDHEKYTQENSDLYVSTSGSDFNTGTSSSDPLATIKTAMIKINASRENPRVVHVAEGTYSPSVSGDMFPINHRSFVTLSGDNRLTTFLEGDTLNRILVSYADTNSCVRNLTLQYGYFEGDGGAVVIENYSNPTFYEVTMKQNHCTHDGGAIWCYEHCSPVFNRVKFDQNSSNNAGGALYLISNDSLHMNHVRLSSNASRYSGGGLHCRSTDFSSISYSSFGSNELWNGDGGGAHFGGGNILLDSVSFIGNNVIGNGGGINTTYGTDFEIKNCEFLLNSASGQGGGFYFYNGVDIDMQNTVFNYNTSVHGGAIYGYYGSSLDIRNGLFHHNTTNYDPVVYGVGDGGALSLNNVVTTLTNVTIANNVSSRDGGGIYFWDSTPIYTDSVVNSIVYNNLPNQIEQAYNASVLVEYTDIQDGWPSGTGNLDVDPDFVAPVGGDYNLQPSSQCIDAGNPDPASDDACFPPSQGTVHNDMGMYGGPMACAWIASDETDIYSYTFGIPPQTGETEIDYDLSEINIEVMEETVLTNLVATFILSEGAMATVDGVEQVSGHTINDFTNPLTYTITAEDGVTTQDWLVTVSSVTTKINMGEYDDLKIYPNPFSTRATVEFSGQNQSINRAVLRDITGKKLFEMDNISSNRLVIQRKGLPNGIYLLELFTNDIKIVKKVIVQ